MTYKLPSHLEPYRGYINNPVSCIEGFETLEDVMNYSEDIKHTTDFYIIHNQVQLLEILYDAGALKKPDCKHQRLEEETELGYRRCSDCGLYVKTLFPNVVETTNFDPSKR